MARKKNTFHCYNCNAELDIPVLHTPEAVDYIYEQLIKEGKAPILDDVELVLKLFREFLARKYGW